MLPVLKISQSNEYFLKGCIYTFTCIVTSRVPSVHESGISYILLQTVTHSMCHPMHIEATSFGEKKEPGWVSSQETGCTPQICLPDPGFGHVFKGLRGTMWKHWGEGKLKLEDLGTWPFMRGFTTGSFWTTDPSLLKGFWCSSSRYVLVLWLRGSGVHWFWGSWRSNSSPLHMFWLHGLLFGSVLTEKQLGILLGSFRAGSAVTKPHILCSLSA